MRSPKPLLLASWCLELCFQQVLAGPLAVNRRQEEEDEEEEEEEGEEEQEASTRAETETASSTVIGTFKPPVLPKLLMVPPVTTSALRPTQIVGSGGLNDFTLALNVTTVAALGQLPLEPKLTPAWAVSGALLLITGLGLCFLGIQTKRVHTLLSVSYLGSLGTVILILHLMSLPVRPAIQGAYLVAVVGTGVLLAGLSVLCKEVFEWFACILGGFCFSMWLLTLREGGLMHGSAVKPVFVIAVLTAAACVPYFCAEMAANAPVRWRVAASIQSWTLITCVSISGATATVLGIDCFNRTGVKEFWAYFRHVKSDRLFPLGTSTYPMKRGIEVGLGVTIVLFLIGLILQFTKWRVMKQRSDQANAERAEALRHLRQVEENQSRQMLQAKERERKAWERVYGSASAWPGTSAKDYLNLEKASGLRGDGVVVEEKETSSGIGATGFAIIPAILGESMQARKSVGTSSPSRQFFVENTDSGSAATRVYSSFSTSSAIQSLILSRHGLIPDSHHNICNKRFLAEAICAATIADGKTESYDMSNPSGSIQGADDAASVSRCVSRRPCSHSWDSIKRKSVRGPHGSSEKVAAVSACRSAEDDTSSMAASLGDASAMGDSMPTPDADHGQDLGEEDVDGVRDEKLSEDSPTARRVCITAAIQEAAEPAATETVTETRRGETSATAPTSRFQAPESGAPDAGEGENSPETGEKSHESLSPVCLSPEHRPPLLILPETAPVYRTNEWARHVSNHAEPLEFQTVPAKAKLRADPSTPTPVYEKPASVRFSEPGQTVTSWTPPPARPLSSSAIDLRTSQKRASFSSQQSATRHSKKVGAPSLAHHAKLAPTIRPNSTLRRSPVATDPIAEEGVYSPNQRYFLDGSTGSWLCRPPVPGVRSCTGPQSLTAQRELLIMRRKTSGPLYPLAPTASFPDPDDVPLAQRREVLRHQRKCSRSYSDAGQPSSASPQPQPRIFMPQRTLSVQRAGIDSHQPRRQHLTEHETTRQVQIARYRASLQASLGGPGHAKLIHRSTNGHSKHALLGQTEAERRRAERERMAWEVRERVNGERMRTDGGVSHARQVTLRRLEGQVRGPWT